jgi:hypothetical protein
MADNTVALQVRPMPQTNILSPISDILNIGRSALTLQKELETKPYAIEQAKAQASQATTGAESAIFKLNNEQSRLALDIAGGLANDPAIINAGKNPQAAMNKMLQAKAMMLAQGVPAHVVEANTAPLVTSLVTNPNNFLQTLQNVIQGGIGATGQQALQTPTLTEAGGAPATFQGGTGRLQTATIAPATPQMQPPPDRSAAMQGAPVPQPGQPTSRPGTFFGDNGTIVDANNRVIFDPAVRDASGNVVDFKATPPEFTAAAPIDRNVGTVPQTFPVAPPAAPQVVPQATQQAPMGVSADQMAAPAAGSPGFKLSYPVRRAGEAAQRLPSEIADENAGNMYRNALLKNQGNLVTNRRNLEEVVSKANDVENNLRALGIKFDSAGVMGSFARKYNEILGTETGVTLKQLNKDLANVAISNISAMGGSLDTVAGQQLTRMANGDETFPPVILKDIARRAMADMTNLNMQANGAQEFARKFGNANLNDYKQQWAKNADSRLFELINIENSSMPDQQRQAARQKLFKDMSDKQKADMAKKLINLQKLSTTGQL